MASLITFPKVLSLGPPKEAALYFEKVFPFDLNDSMFKSSGFMSGEIDPNAIPYDGKTWDLDVLSSLLGSVDDARRYADHALVVMIMLLFRQYQKNRNILDELDDGPRNFLISEAEERLNIKLENIFHPEKSDDVNVPQPLNEAIKRILAKDGYDTAPTWKTATAEAISASTSNELGPERVIAALKGLDLVEPDGVPWETVIELRKDRKAMEEMRAFRLFFAETFKDEDESYIIDKILHLHDKHKEIAKMWGMKTKQRSLSVILDKPTLVGSTIAGAALGLVGGPLAVAGALAIPIGKAALELTKIKIEAKEAVLDRPLQYLTRLEELNISR